MHVAIVKASFTKAKPGAKAAIRYIQHRPGNEQTRITRTLFGCDGQMSKEEAYRCIDRAHKGSIFFRFVISPDPAQEDTDKDLHLRQITETTMLTLEERLHQHVSWVGAVHDDHAPHRHVHVVAVVQGRLQVQDFQVLRQTATEVCLHQRRERDCVLEQQNREREEGESRGL